MARFIFTTGKMIRDRIFRMQNLHLASQERAKSLSDLSLPQLHLIMMLRAQKRASISELASLLGVSSPSVSAMVDRLVERGLLRREPDPADRRRVVVSIAPSVQQDVCELEDAMLGSFVDIVEKVGMDTARRWCEVLAEVRSVLENEEGGS
jgi:DNA-binding MarR family transcriptional regulator